MTGKIETAEDQFAATLAHQLKTPIAALQAASTNLRRNLSGLLEDLAMMDLAADSLEATTRFISRAVREPAPPRATGLLPDDRVDVTATRLAGAGLEGDLRTTAASLIRGGWDTYLDEIAPLLRGGRPMVLDVLETTARLRTNLDSIEASLLRIREVAGALRLLSGRVDAGVVDIGRSLESTLALFAQTLPPGVVVTTHLSALPPVAGRADLLAEVWTNLIANATQAMGETGRIRIEAERRDAAGEVVVRFIDDGPGIPADALPRVFDTFFTTRAAEGGTGLGLPLARRILDKLGGSIQVDSEPGRTCFTVALPAAGADAAQNVGVPS